MNFELYTVGIKHSQNARSIMSYDTLLDELLIPQSIKAVIDFRAINTFIKYSDNNKYNPINFHQLLKEDDINYYNLSDLYRSINLSISGLSEKSERVVARDSGFNRLLDVIKVIGNSDGDICLLFPTQYTLVQRYPQKLSMRGVFCKVMYTLHPDLKLNHFVAYLEGRNLFSNRELWRDSYGELITIRKDMRDKAKPETYTYDGDEDDSSSYSQQDLNDMYRDAYDGNPEASWNND